MNGFPPYRIGQRVRLLCAIVTSSGTLGYYYSDGRFVVKWDHGTEITYKSSDWLKTVGPLPQDAAPPTLR